MSGNHEDAIEETRNRLQEILNNQQAANKVSFDIEVVEEIPNDPLTGKYKLVVNDMKSKS